MGFVDREHIPALQQDWRYSRLLNLAQRKARHGLNQRFAAGLRALEETRGHTMPQQLHQRPDHRDRP